MRWDFSPPAVIRFSIPEDHHVSLPCGCSDSSDVVWTHQDRKVPVTRQGGYETNEDRRRYLLLPDGGLRLLQLDDSDGGEYRCNQQLVAELQVLSGGLRVELGAVHHGSGGHVQKGLQTVGLISVQHTSLYRWVRTHSRGLYFHILQLYFTTSNFPAELVLLLLIF